MLFTILITYPVLADDYQKGLDAYKQKDTKAALIYFKKSCEAKNGDACLAVAELQGKNQSSKVVLSYMTKACNYGNGRSCEMLGRAYSQGKIVKKDSRMANAYYKKAIANYEKECKNGKASACSKMSNYYTDSSIVKKDFVKAIFFYDKACQLEPVNFCESLGDIYEQGTPPAGKADPALAEKYFKKACDHKNEIACRKYNYNNEMKMKP